MTDDDNTLILELTADVVSAYVSRNSVAAEQIPSLIATVSEGLNNLGAPEADPVAERPDPAVPIRSSVKHDYIICLEDGKKFKTLKRHLKNQYDLTPEQYRARWGLKPDYPMVAPAYSERRSKLAKEIGLGRKPGR